jgi:hypothetical protein
MPVGSSSVGFVLSFQDMASQPIRDVTKSYLTMVRAMELAKKKASDTLKFTKGLSRMTKAIKEVTLNGAKAISTLTGISGLIGGSTSRGRSTNINVHYKIPKMAKGGIVKKRPGGTLAVLGEGAYDEAVTPLKKRRMGSKSPLEGSVQDINIKMENPLLIKNAAISVEEMVKQFGKGRKEWEKTFGKDAVKLWDILAKDSAKINKETKGSSTNMDRLAKDIKDTKFMTALQNLSGGGAMAGMGMSGVSSEVTNNINSFLEATTDLQKSKAFSREALKQQRQMLRGVFGGMSGDVNKAAEAYSYLVKIGEEADKETAHFARSVSQISEMTGTDLTEAAANLSFHLDMSKKNIVGLYSALREVSKNKEFRVSFGEVVDTLDSYSKQLGILHGLTDESKKSISTGIASLAAGLHSASVPAEQINSLMGTLVDSLTDPELQKSLKRIGLDPLEALKSGHPEKVIEILGKLSERMKAGSYYSGKLAGVYQEKFSIASDILFQMQGRTEDATEATKKFNKQALIMGKDEKGVNNEFKGTQSLFANITNNLENFLKLNKILGPIGDTLEHIGPAMVQVHAGVALLTEAPETFHKMGQAATAFGKGIKNAGKWVSITAKTTSVFGLAMSGAEGLSTGVKSAGKALKWFGTVIKITTVLQGIAAAATWAWSAAMVALNFLFVATPIGWIVLALAALVAIIILCVKNWDKITAAVKDFFGWIGETAAFIWDEVQPAFKAIGNFLAKVFTPIIDFVKKHFLLFLGPIGLIIEAFKIIKGLFSKKPSGDGFMGWVKKGIEFLLKPIDWLFEKISGIWNMFFGSKTPSSQIQSSVVDRTAKNLEPVKTINGKPVLTKADNNPPEVTVNQEDVVKGLNRVVGCLQDIKEKGSMNGNQKSPRSSMDRLVTGGG